MLVGVSALQADFAIYTGSGTWDPSITAFKNFLEWKGLTWQEVNKNHINNGGLIGNYRGLFMPGGWAGDYNRDIKDSGDQHIRDFIAQGGAYIGFSAGAFYACDVTVWEGQNLDYPSDIFDGDCIGPIEEIAPWPEYTMTTMNINLAHEANAYEPAQRDVLYYGEPYFVAHPGQEMQVFASWIVPSNPQIDGRPGIIGFNYGIGRVFLVGPHPEIDEDDSRDGTDFGEELSDGLDGSDWPFIWTGVDWVLRNPISQPPGAEITECNDGIDNDNDGFSDSADFACQQGGLEENSFLAQCQDSADNDNDSLIDYPYDLDCETTQDNDESAFIGPVELFFDDFEDGSLSEWVLTTVENNWYAGTTNPYQGNRHAEAKPQNTNEPASVMEKTISTSGFNSVEFSYYRKLAGLDTADDFEVQYFDGTWHSVEHLGSGSANDGFFVGKSFTLSGTASKIRFKCEVGAVSEKCFVDNVRLSAE